LGEAALVLVAVVVVRWQVLGRCQAHFLLMKRPLQLVERLYHLLPHPLLLLVAD
jgi:hypothetical protein